MKRPSVQNQIETGFAYQGKRINIEEYPNPVCVISSKDGEITLSVWDVEDAKALIESLTALVHAHDTPADAKKTGGGE
jgi:hypothetical protein